MGSRKNALIGTAKAFGLLSKDFQQVSSLTCAQGHTQDLLEAVAHVLLVEALPQGTVPPAMGEKTPELLDRAEQSLKIVAQKYTSSGGVLTAKRHVSVLGLVAEMSKQWLESFKAPLAPVEALDKGYDEDGVLQRLALSARRILARLGEASGTSDKRMAEMLANPRGHALVLSAENVEDFCKKAAFATLEAFLEPEWSIHKEVHGEQGEQDE